MILIVAPVRDLHAQCVAKHLLDMGAHIQMLDLGSFADSAAVSYSLATGSGSKVAISFSDGGHLDLAEVRTVWYRRPRLPRLSHAFPFEADRAFALAEWDAMFNGMIASLEARFVNDPIKQRSASKPCQLQVAKQAGLAIPETLITNNAGEVRRFVERLRCRVIHKALTAPSDRFLATKRWSEADDAALRNLRFRASIFQEEI